MKTLILVGGGHSHFEVLRKLSRKDWRKQWQVKLIADKTFVPYSGMFPGLVAGWYTFEQCTLDLQKVCQKLGIELILSKAQRVDFGRQELMLASGQVLTYDLLSLNVGALPKKPQDDSVGIKPIDIFLREWEKIAKTPPLRVCVVGAGAAACEVAIALKLRTAGSHVNLLGMDPPLQHSHGELASKVMLKRLSDLKIEYLQKQAQQFRAGKLICDDEELAFDFCVWATGPQQAPEFVTELNAAKDKLGFLLVNDHLQVGSHFMVFAAGDCVNHRGSLRSGVYAVRQGQVLAENLASIMSGSTRPLKPFVPKASTLNLITSGPQRALLHYGEFVLEGSWCWWLKNKIDTGYMRKAQELY